jgi:hypothetical protein
VLASSPTAHTAPERDAAALASEVPSQPLGAIRGVTIGPIENAYHPGKGYASEPYLRTVYEAIRSGATWVALTPFGRVADLNGTGVDPTFETPHAVNRRVLLRAIQLAHAAGLRVFLVPHLWVESGEWRALIDPKTDAGWKRWVESYTAYVLGWAAVAEATHVELLSMGVELRSWVTTARAPAFLDLVRRVRGIYHGKLTYSANWDDAADTVVWGALDYIGVNAFFPLTDKEGASLGELRAGGARAVASMDALGKAWGRPVVFTEFGYTTRTDPALRPWEWPDTMKDVKVDQVAQAQAYHGLLAEVLDSKVIAGFFVWRVYADPDDVSQESEWGFSPRGKQSEIVLRDAFSARFGVEGSLLSFRPEARVPGLLPGPTWPGDSAAYEHDLGDLRR